MAAKSLRDADSPSSSSVLLPQLRHSRRGSLSSFASTTQLDKETISQALDQIHSTASQSDSLTTFNEYTDPPSSSSGPDSKSLAGELSGGLSGLYNRFRASVGNVKDIVNSGLEDETSEKISAESPAALTPAPTTSVKCKNDATQPYAAISPSDSGRSIPIKVDWQPAQVPQADPHNKAQLKAQSDRVSSKPVLESVHALKPPSIPLNQSAYTTPLASVETEHGTPHLSDAENSQIVEVRHTIVSSSMNKCERDVFLNNDSRLSETENREERISSEADVDGMKDLPPVANQPTAKAPKAIHDEQLPSDLQIGTPEDVFSEPQNKLAHLPTINPEKRSAHQHLEIPLRKSLAPPLVSLSGSPRPSISQASSTDTNLDSLHGVTHQSPSHQDFSGAGRERSSDIKERSKSTYSRNQSTLSVLSQAKNKVLNKEYWMKDENARDCFCCGDPFSTFRRKHHCSM